jgi:hypothetical protein
METIVSNLLKSTKRTTLQGKQYLVAPITLIVPGVLDGSKGALLYESEELAKNVDAWNGMPLTLRHPSSEDGKPLSARSPYVREQVGLGSVYNAELLDGKLVAEGWFDLERTRLLSPALVEALESGNAIELSTGLFSKNETAPPGSSFNGVDYTHIVKKIRPDHLAILTDQVGACSLSDGCGVLNNASSHYTIIQNEEDSVMSLTKEQKTKLIGELIENCGYCTEEDVPAFNKLSDEALELRRMDMEDRKAAEAVVNAVSEYAGKDVSDLPEFIVNKAKEEKEVEKEAKKVVEKETTTVNKTKTKEEEAVVNETPEPKTEEEWLAEAPPSIQATLNFAKKVEDGAKETLVQRIAGSIEGDKQRETVVNQLRTESLDKLQVLEALATPAVQETQMIAPSYAGQAGPAPLVNKADELDQSDSLELPIYNFKEEMEAV